MGEDKVTTVKAGDTITREGTRLTVLPACEDKHGGMWHCVTHPHTVIRNQFEKDIHISDDRRHKLAWACWLHGFEEP